MNARKLKRGDRIAVVSLSRGLLGEEDCRHLLEPGIRRMKEWGLEPVFMPNSMKGIEYLKNHPDARARDLKDAFFDHTIKGIICAIGGDDTYRLLPYLMEDEEFIRQVKSAPKLFTGFSDTTINHLMLYKLGLQTFYGPNFICDLAEMGPKMLPYTKAAFQSYFENPEKRQICSSSFWYEERKDFSGKSLGTERKAHKETRGFEVLQGKGKVKYGLFPAREEWRGKILFLETCEEKTEPELLLKKLLAIKERGVFEEINGCLIGKPQDEAYYEEYKTVYREGIGDPGLPVLYNVNFGHAYPRCVLPYGIMAEIDLDRKEIWLLEKMFGERGERAHDEAEGKGGIPLL